MPSNIAQDLITKIGDIADYKFSRALMLSTATTTTAFAVTRFEPWTETKAKSLLDHHPLAVWSEVTCRVAPMAGVYGRMVTFYGGWAASGVSTPTTVEGMLTLNNAVYRTYGGTGDPGMMEAEIRCVFDNTMTDLLKTPEFESLRPVFFYCFVETDVVAALANTSPRFQLVWTGKYKLFGRF